MGRPLPEVAPSLDRSCPPTPDNLLIHLLDHEDERLTWMTNATVYLLDGTRFIVWTDPCRGSGLTPLPAEYEPDNEEVAVSSLRDVREGFKA